MILFEFLNVCKISVGDMVWFYLINLIFYLYYYYINVHLFFQRCLSYCLPNGDIWCKIQVKEFSRETVQACPKISIHDNTSLTWSWWCRIYYIFTEMPLVMYRRDDFVLIPMLALFISYRYDFKEISALIIHSI